MGAERHVLCIARAGCAEQLCNALAGTEWQLTAWWPDGHGPVPAGEFRVGIVCVESPGPDWLNAVESILRSRQSLRLIAVPAVDAMADPRVAEFINLHCIDYQTRPIDRDRLLFALGHAEGMAALALQTRERARDRDPRSELAGISPSIQALRADLHKVARTDAPVLLTGESGTGKELVARSIHQRSARRAGPCIAVNCVALPPTLIHAELFGYERGAFTGAHKRRIGQLEAANGGTIFLDEIGDLDPDLQSLLLRFLQEHTIRRIGGLDDVSLDVRVIAATHVDIEAAIRNGRFREDLYYRLNVLRLHLPPLRERHGDAIQLADIFFERFNAEHGGSARGFEAAALRAIEAYPWPGNVRELMNRVRRAVIMAEGPLVTPGDLQLPEVAAGCLQNLGEARLTAERAMVLAALNQSDWRASKAAVLLGVSRATFYRLLSRHGLATEDTGRMRQPAPAG